MSNDALRALDEVDNALRIAVRESPLCRSVRWDGRSTLLAVAFKDK